MKSSILLFIILAASPFFFIGGPGAHGSRSFVALWDLGHVLFFCLFTSFCCNHKRFVGWPLSFVGKASVLFVFVLLLGTGIELLQNFSNGRISGLQDIVRNQLGCLIALTWFCSCRQDAVFGKSKKFLMLIVAFWGCITLVPLSRALVDEYIAREQFPLLAGFETRFERDRWEKQAKADIREMISESGEHVLRVELTTDTYSGIGLRHFQGDWSAYSYLRMNVYHEGDEALMVSVRIHDDKHKNEYSDRYNGVFSLHKGWNTISISLRDVELAPRGRLMDMIHIRNLKLFVIRQEKERVIFLDNVCLY